MCTQRADIQQRTFEFEFNVGELKASLLKSTPSGPDKLLAVAVLQNFGLDFVLRKWDMAVNVYLKALFLDMLESKIKDGKIITSDNTASSSQDLVRIRYHKVQKESPEFMSVYEGADQTIDAELSTLTLRAEPEPVLSLYDFIMTTFVPSTTASDAVDATPLSEDDKPQQGEQKSSDKIRIRAKLTSIQRKPFHFS